MPSDCHCLIFLFLFCHVELIIVLHQGVSTFLAYGLSWCLIICIVMHDDLKFHDDKWNAFVELSRKMCYLFRLLCLYCVPVIQAYSTMLACRLFDT